jgi:hypothetical protein
VGDFKTVGQSVAAGEGGSGAGVQPARGRGPAGGAHDGVSTGRGGGAGPSAGRSG